MNTKSEAQQVVLQVAGEGGGYTILGACSSGHWRFWRDGGGGDSWMFDDEPNSAAVELPPTTSEPVNIGFATIDEALSNISHSWPSLHPIEVHPDFAAHILSRVEKYLATKTGRNDDRSLAAWREACQLK